MHGKSQEWVLGLAYVCSKLTAVPSTETQTVAKREKQQHSTEHHQVPS